MDRPESAAIASGLGTIGGITTVIAMAYDLCSNPSRISAVTVGTITIYLTVAILFFSSAGFLYRNGNGRYLPLIFIESVNVLMIFTCLAPLISLRLVDVLGTIAIGVVVLSSLKKVRNWIAWDRL